MSTDKKAGPITFAIGLIFFGVVLLVANFTGVNVFTSILNFWPVLLIGLGIEYFIRSYMNKKQGGVQTTRFHLPTVLIILLAVLVGFIGHQVNSLFKNEEILNLVREAVGGTSYNYERIYKSSEIEVVPGNPKLYLNDLNGNINLIPSTDNKLRIQASIMGWGPTAEEAKRRADMVNIKVDQGSIIAVTRMKDQSENIRRQAEVRYQIMVPKGLMVEIEGQHERIKADGLEGNVHIDLSGGDVRIANLKGNVDYFSEYGEATFQDITGNLSVQSENGSLRISNVNGGIRANMSHGITEITSTRQVNSNYIVNNQSGDIRLSIPENSNVKIVAKTENGSILGSLGLNEKAEQSEENNTDPEDIKSKQGETVAETTLGSGKASISLTNRDGSITVNKN